MSKILENKFQIIHIVAEITTIIGLGLYFSQKNKKLLADIEILTNRLQEQEDLIQKHEKMIVNLANMFDEHFVMSQQILHPKIKSSKKKIQSNIISKNIQSSPSITIGLQKILKSPKPSVSFNSVVEEVNESESDSEKDEDDDTEEELDKELENELKDLEN
jgi:hypothetical protein